MLGAFTPTGSYTVVNDQVTIKLNLIRNKEPVATLTVEGTITDDHNKALLAEKVVNAISTGWFNNGGANATCLVEAL